MRDALATVSRGAALPDWEVGPLTRTMCVRYAGASGDLNPIHFDDDDARAAGFDRAFAPGMLLGGLVATYLVRFADPSAVRKMKLRFVDQAYLGEVITVGATARSVNATPAGRTVVLELAARTGSATTVLTGAAVVELADGGTE